MKFNLLTALLILTSLLNPFLSKDAYSENNVDDGKNTFIVHIDMKGRVFDNACGIDMDSQEQTIDLNIKSFPEINDVPVDFNINLTNCDEAEAQGELGNTSDRVYKKFNIIFDALLLTPNLVKLQGEAKGFGIEIQDEQGNTIFLGKPLLIKHSKLNSLKFKLKLTPYAAEPFKMGRFSASVRYRIDYI